MENAARMLVMFLWIPFIIIGFGLAFVFYGLQSGWHLCANMVDLM